MSTDDLSTISHTLVYEKIDLAMGAHGATAAGSGRCYV